MRWGRITLPSSVRCSDTTSLRTAASQRKGCSITCPVVGGACDWSCDWSCDGHVTVMWLISGLMWLLSYIWSFPKADAEGTVARLHHRGKHTPIVPTLHLMSCSGAQTSGAHTGEVRRKIVPKLTCEFVNYFTGEAPLPYLQPPSYWPWTLAFCLRFCPEHNQTDSLVFHGSWFTPSPWPCPRAALTDTCTGGTAGGTEDNQLRPEEGRAGGEATTCSGGEGTQVPEGARPWAQVPYHGCLYQHHEDHKEEGLILTPC